MGGYGVLKKSPPQWLWLCSDTGAFTAVHALVIGGGQTIPLTGRILPTITAPTLVIHARDDVVPVQTGGYLADHIPDARLLEVEGRDHVPWLTDPDRILTGIEEFLTGSHAAP